jgi:hypothetical protein
MLFWEGKEERENLQGRRKSDSAQRNGSMGAFLSIGFSVLFESGFIQGQGVRRLGAWGTVLGCNLHVNKRFLVLGVLCSTQVNAGSC